MLTKISNLVRESVPQQPVEETVEPASFQNRINALVSQLKDTNAVEPKDDLLAIITEHNRRTEALLAELAVLANLSRVKKDAEMGKLAKDLILALNVSPRMAESVANIYRPRLGGSYRHMRASFWSIARHTKLNPNRIAWKRAARLFAMKIGLRTPELFQDGVPHRDIVINSPCVVKPLNEDGGVGVHAIIYRGGTYVDLFDKKQAYASLDDLKARFARLLAEKKVRVDEWLVEELILPPSGNLADSRDLKFFSFYGEIGYVLQVDRWSKGKPARAMFTKAGEPVNVSKFYSIPTEPFAPTFTKDDIALASKVSSELPWPGIRIDFLNGKDGLVFGEFTVNPGAYGGFFEEPDQYLGGLWAKAAGKLYDDMLRGKKFDAYYDFLNQQTGLLTPPPLIGHATSSTPMGGLD